LIRKFIDIGKRVVNGATTKVARPRGYSNSASMAKPVYQRVGFLTMYESIVHLFSPGTGAWLLDYESMGEPSVNACILSSANQCVGPFSMTIEFL
jgi:hypothetical protein